ncbi:hypothetical protein C1J03_06940 [Sulfitobacter sp. SK012]|nr:hypothetical protein C1J03_06940 [Sulfitobacter sp. SK012]
MLLAAGSYSGKGILRQAGSFAFAVREIPRPISRPEKYKVDAYALHDVEYFCVHRCDLNVG